MKSGRCWRIVLPFAIGGALLANYSTAKAEVSDEEFAKKFEAYASTEKGAATIGNALQTFVNAQRVKAQKEEEQKEKAQLEEQFKNPVKVDVGSSPTLGPADAKITIVEFSDFQCPFCRRGYTTMKEVMSDFKSDVKLVFKNLPLDFHPNALPAAKAAIAAHKQGKFWEMHDALFDNQAKLGDAGFFEEQAKKIGLNVAKFNTDMNSEAVAKEIEADKAIAGKLGIQGTPGFFVNGVAVKGAYPKEHFKKIIDRWLGKGEAAAVVPPAETGGKK